MVEWIRCKVVADAGWLAGGREGWPGGRQDEWRVEMDGRVVTGVGGFVAEIWETGGAFRKEWFGSALCFLD